MIFFKLNGEGQLADDIKFMNQVQASWEKKKRISYNYMEK
jgi:hypothetical protein